MKKLLLIIFYSFKVLPEIIPQMYEHETFVLINERDHSFPLNDKVKNAAYQINRQLGLSKFFDTSMIVNEKWVSSELSKDLTHSEFKINTSDGNELICSFFDRKKNTVIVIGPGFTNAKEKMVPFAHMFLDYDVVLMNFRGHGIRNLLSPLYLALGFTTESKLGADEEKDVFAVIEYLRKLKPYAQVIGLGVCLGAFMFAKAEGIAQEKNQLLFDKLILDGCWLSLDKFKDKIFADPYLIINPQKGGASDSTKWFFSNKSVSKFILKLTSYLFNISLENINITSFIKKFTNIPVLFFYGKDDLTIYREEFETLWNSCNSPNKMAIITSNPHVHNHLRNKELYKLICEFFIDLEIQKTIKIIANPESTKKRILKQLKSTIFNSYTDILKRKKI